MPPSTRRRQLRHHRNRKRQEGAEPAPAQPPERPPETAATGTATAGANGSERDDDGGHRKEEPPAAAADDVSEEEEEDCLRSRRRCRLRSEAAGEGGATDTSTTAAAKVARTFHTGKDVPASRRSAAAAASSPSAAAEVPSASQVPPARSPPLCLRTTRSSAAAAAATTRGGGADDGEVDDGTAEEADSGSSDDDNDDDKKRLAARGKKRARPAAGGRKKGEQPGVEGEECQGVRYLSGTPVDSLRQPKRAVPKEEEDRLVELVRKENVDLLESDEALEASAELGVSWREAGANRAWEERFLELLVFGRAYGHLQVPKVFVDNPKLGRWVVKQRAWMKKKDQRLTPSRLRRLEAAGFVWDPKNHKDFWKIQNNTTKSDCVWEERFAELMEYKRQKGDCHVPKEYPTDQRLARWVSKQRKHYRAKREKKYHTLDDEKERRLEEAGFVFNTKTKEMMRDCVFRRYKDRWDVFCDKLIAFKEEFGHAAVPRRWKRDPQLACWVMRQRLQYRKQQSGEYSYMTEARLERLKEIGFVFGDVDRRLYPVEPDKKHAADTKNPPSTSPTSSPTDSQSSAPRELSSAALLKDTTDSDAIERYIEGDEMEEDLAVELERDDALPLPEELEQIKDGYRAKDEVAETDVLEGDGLQESAIKNEAKASKDKSNAEAEALDAARIDLIPNEMTVSDPEKKNEAAASVLGPLKEIAPRVGTAEAAAPQVVVKQPAPGESESPLEEVPVKETAEDILRRKKAQEAEAERRKIEEKAEAERRKIEEEAEAERRKMDEEGKIEEEAEAERRKMDEEEEDKRDKGIRKGVWTCKICNADEFRCFVDACAHEAACAGMSTLALAAAIQLE